MADEAKLQELDQLKARVHALELKLQAERTGNWPPKAFYGAYHATTGFMLGLFGATVSLMLNVIGAPIAGKNPLELIRVYLTFPLGAKALLLTDSAQKAYVVPDGVILAIGCCLYLVTGMFLGIIFQLAFSRFIPRAGLVARMLLGTVLALAIWLFNFYAILAWLQPLLFGGNWIVDSAYLPPWVAAGTHVVFGITMAIVYPLGKFIPYQNQNSPEHS